MEHFFVATSYAPGHNFWPGSPLSWWMRGILAFGLVTAPGVMVLILAVGWCRRKKGWAAFAISVFACAATYALWPEIIGLRFKDGDMPWYIGLRWGDRARLWLFASALIGAAVATVTGSRDSRGFPVMLEPTLARESARSNK